jgi:hypothetical protein
MLEYTQKAGVDSVFVMTLLPTDKPQKGDYILHVEAKLREAQNAKEVAPFEKHPLGKAALGMADGIH